MDPYKPPFDAKPLPPLLPSFETCALVLFLVAGLAFAVFGYVDQVRNNIEIRLHVDEHGRQSWQRVK